MFANSFNLSETEKLEKWNEVFSYLGNNSNPPDAMLRGGDAIEIKKLETDSKELALNHKRKQTKDLQCPTYHEHANK